MRILGTAARTALATALPVLVTLAHPGAAHAGRDPVAALAPVAQAAPAAAEPAPVAAASDGGADFEYDEEPTGFPDPLERTNRTIFAFDQQLSRFVVDPVTKIYQFIVPDVARHCVRRFFLNVSSPSVLINDLLQREWGDAGITVERFAVNTTIGIGGLFDPADSLGLEPHISDFGQTLALAGVGSGPYLVMPFLGPSTARDAVGGVVDLFLQPTLYFLPFAQIFVYEGSLGLSAREAHAEGLAALKSSSIDYYSALRNAYYQNRMGEIWARREDHRPDAIPADSGGAGTAVVRTDLRAVAIRARATSDRERAP